MFAGAHTALVTPFRDREFDEPTFRSLIDAPVSYTHLTLPTTVIV